MELKAQRYQSNVDARCGTRDLTAVIFWTHVKPWEWQQRMDAGQRPPKIVLDVKEQPYTTPLGENFELTRVWGRGGKTNIWGRVSLRYSDLDFAGPERDGWEISVPDSL